MKGDSYFPLRIWVVVTGVYHGPWTRGAWAMGHGILRMAVGAWGPVLITHFRFHTGANGHRLRHFMHNRIIAIECQGMGVDTGRAPEENAKWGLTVDHEPGATRVQCGLSSPCEPVRTCVQALQPIFTIDSVCEPPACTAVSCSLSLTALRFP